MKNHFNPIVAMVFFKTYGTLQLGGGGVNDPQLYLGFCAT